MTILKADVKEASKVIENWKSQNKISSRNAFLLLEAYRRFNMFGRRDRYTISETWVGLGYKSEYGASPFFTPLNGMTPPRGAQGWWLLKENGKKLVSKLVSLLPWREDYNHLLFTGDLS